MRLGILGGTFNPIHIGHLILAECARQQCRLDQVWFVPAATPPHKASPQLLPGATRLALIRLAIAGHPAFRASDLELKRGGVSYTIDTVLEIKRRHPAAQLVLIVGSDLLRVRWYRLEELARLCTFAVAERPTAALLRRRFPRMQRLAMLTIGISSSAIRARLRHGRSIRYLVPDAVAAALQRHRGFQRGTASA